MSLNFKINITRSSLPFISIYLLYEVRFVYNVFVYNLNYKYSSIIFFIRILYMVLYINNISFAELLKRNFILSIFSSKKIFHFLKTSYLNNYHIFYHLHLFSVICSLYIKINYIAIITATTNTIDRPFSCFRDNCFLSV